MLRRSFALLALAPLLLASALLQAGDALPRAEPAALGFDPQRLGRLGSTLQAYVDEGRLSGAVLLVARRGRLAYLESFGLRDLESRAPMQPDSIFRIASQTKALVSVGVMQLVEEGRVSLTDPLAKYIPEFADTTVAVPKDGGGYDVVPAKRPITLRDLLTHTSGIGYGSGPAADRWAAAGIQGWYFADRDEPIAATVARMAALPFDAQPGERFVYGYNTDILGAVIERVSGMPLDRFLRERITGPLGMQDTHFYLPPAQRERLATVYSLVDGKLARAPDAGGMVSQGAYVAGPRRAFSGGAGLLSTAGDYARFLQMLLDGGELDGTRILSPKSVELMTVDHVGALAMQPGTGFGLGFSVVEDLGLRGSHGSVGEFGWGGAYHTTYWVDPQEELVVVYLTQLLPAAGIDDHAKVRALVYQAIVD